MTVSVTDRGISDALEQGVGSRIVLEGSFNKKGLLFASETLSYRRSSPGRATLLVGASLIFFIFFKHPYPSSRRRKYGRERREEQRDILS